MQICILGMKGNFDKNLGQGVQIYNYQIWNNIKRIVRPPSNVEKVELGFGESPITRKISFTIACLCSYGLNRVRICQGGLSL